MDPAGRQHRPGRDQAEGELGTLNAQRNSALRPDSATISVVIARSPAATGNPQYSSAAKQNVTEATPASELDLPGVTIGLSSPSRDSAISTQNSPWPATPRRLAGDSPCDSPATRAPSPATVTTVR